LDLKHKIIAELEAVVGPKTIIGTNTSSLTLAEMGAKMKNPERLVGMHFFNPPHKMPLVEVVAGKNTDKEAVATAVDLCRSLGKTPIVVGDCPGFLVNRITIPGLCEIVRMYEEGASFQGLEKMMLDFGMPMGIFELCDEVGIDVLYHVCQSFQKAYGDRMDTPKLIAAMYDKKLLGKKTGKGFYIHEGKDRRFNEEVEVLRKNIGKSPRTITEEEMRNRVFLTMINEASRCLDEKIVAGPGFLDMATVMGTGFPPFRGGLLRYADTIGPQKIVETLKGYTQTIGPRFAPSQKLLSMQQANQRFY
jgi:3-hydroxyacyl-CoA dehydrogenase/enoyl-CoA hydratase/3-hydroxybutyryl-CoA epimerase